jgi:hypothetical protein
MSKNKQPPGDQLPALSGEDAAMYGRYTGQGIRKRDPEKYAAVVRALQHGLSINQCAKVFKLDKDTVGAICVRELGPGGMRKATENNLRLLAHKASTDLIEDMDKISATQKAVVLGITLDKLERAEDRRGHPTSLTQNNTMHVHAPNISVDAVREFFSGLKGGPTGNPQTIDVKPTKETENERNKDN